mmetsp:Transcript_20756/g.36850  ORF Transcript_20756/g.36850 Transcript_20756/m.36850 type:complete len:89 (-) Transcript_20756:1315-1581(-)
MQRSSRVIVVGLSHATSVVSWFLSLLVGRYKISFYQFLEVSVKELAKYVNPQSLLRANSEPLRSLFGRFYGRGLQLEAVPAVTNVIRP